MKKLALSAILGASLMVTSSAFALTAMTDSNMKAATGQAGVSIALDNVVIEQYVGSTTYTDSDGTMGAAGSIVISDKHVIKQYLAMTSATDFATDFRTATGGVYDTATSTWTGGVAATGDWKKAAALTIDVGTCNVLSAGLEDVIASRTAAQQAAIGTAVGSFVAAMTGGTAQEEALNDAAIDLVENGTASDIGEAKIFILNVARTSTDVTGVVIGLPTLLIATTSDTYSVGVAKTGAVNSGSNFITITKGASAMAILGGTIEIAAH